MVDGDLPSEGPEKSLRRFIKEDIEATQTVVYIIQGDFIVNAPPSGRSMATWEKPAIFVSGVFFVAIMLIIAMFFPTPTPFQYLVFRIVLALAAAGFAAPIPGLIHVDIPYVKAGGAIAVFVIVFYFNPAALVVASALTSP